MSVSSLFTPNPLALYAGSITSNTIDANTINTTEYQISSLYLYNSTANTKLVNSSAVPVTLTLKYNYTGVCTLFYDANTDTAVAPGASCASIKLGDADGLYTITGLPEIRGVNGITYNHTLYYASAGAVTTGRIKLTKVDSETCNIEIFNSSGNIPNATVGIIPFTFDYLVQN